VTVPPTPETSATPALSPLPIDEVLDAVCASLRAAPSVVLRAPTGSGKTTRVPGALLDRGVVTGAVWVSQPRRVAARAAARRIAEERGARLGDEVGYQVRYEKRAGADTRVLFLTDGLLLRRLQADPLLEGVGALVFDEVHERRLDTDLTLALARQVQREMRPDLRIVVMSATLDAQPFARFLGDCPTIDAAGRAYDVAIDYLAERDERRVTAVMATHLPRVLTAREGDVLAFLPGVGEIEATAAELARAGVSAAGGVSVVPLHGSLPPREQDAALAPGAARKVILATNVAETSLTIPGIRCVVDGGWARVARYDSGCGLDRLELERISRASAEQRAGRAGREAPGHCLRLWTRGQQADLTAATTPEVARVDLASAILELLLWGERDPLAFAWLEAPPEGAVVRALELLERLGATDGGALTALGKRLAARPLPPRLARVLDAGELLGLPEDAALLAALLAERDPFRGRDRDEPTPPTRSDTLERLDALRRAGRGPARAPGYGEAHPGAVAALAQAASHLTRSAAAPARPDVASTSREERLGRALLAGYPDRVAARRREDPARAVLVGGRGVRLAPACGVREAPLFVCV
jgi:ATP-dependent helicase HrpB